MRRQSITDENYIELLAKKDERALYYVIENYGGLVMSVIRHLLQGFPDEQEECFDDVLMKVWEHIENYNKDLCSFRGWIVAIARYQSIDRLRRIGRENEKRVIRALDDVKDVQAVNDAFLNIEETIDDEINSMLECLSPDDREIFKRLYIEGESAREVGKALNITESNIYARASRGRKRLRVFLKNRKENEYDG